MSPSSFELELPRSQQLSCFFETVFLRLLERWGVDVVGAVELRAFDPVQLVIILHVLFASVCGQDAVLNFRAQLKVLSFVWPLCLRLVNLDPFSGTDRLQFRLYIILLFFPYLPPLPFLDQLVSFFHHIVVLILQIAKSVDRFSIFELFFEIFSLYH